MKTETADRIAIVWVVALGLALSAGLWARLSGFGGRGLAVDEAYFASNAAAILDHGLPRLLDGGYYVVGLIPQYLTALSTALFGSSEAALRLPALLAGLALPALAYRYVRGHAPAVVAVAVAIAVLVSSWQIEISRFARMYALFGCATLLFLTRFDRSLAGPEWDRRYWTHAWAAIAALCHREGVLLAPLLFAPLLEPARFGSGPALWRYAGVTALTVGAIGLYGIFDFRRFGASDLYPDGYEPINAGALRLPAETLWGASPKVALAVVAASLLAALAFAVRRRWCVPSTIALLACVAALLHQLTLAGLLVVALLARSSFDAALARRLAGIAGCAAVWPAIALLGGGEWSASSFRTTFFGWPELFESIVRPWSAALPWTGLLIAGAVLWTLLREKRSWLETLASPAGVAAYCVVCFGLLRYFYETPRYHFFLYAALLGAVAVAFSRALGPNRGAAAFLVAFLAAGDFDPRHIARVSGPDASFRMGPFEGRAELWYPRADYRGAAHALTELTEKDSPGVVIATAEPVPHYFPGEFVRYLDREEYPFWEQSRREGSVEMWTGRPLLSTAEELRDWSADRKAVLLVRRYPGDAEELDPQTVWGERVAAARRVFVSVDGGVDIVRVDFAPQPSGSPEIGSGAERP